jgi:hypothetical protein
MALLHFLNSLLAPVPVSNENPLPVSGAVGGAAISSSNPEPVTGAVQPLVTSSDWTATGDVQNGALTDTMKAAPGASLYNVIDYLTLSAGTLGAAATVSIKDGAAGTVKWQGRLQTTGCAPTTHVFNPPIAASANTLLEIATTDPTSGLIYWSAGGTVVA